VIHFVCSLLCLGIVGFGPWLIHFIWRGKWDLAIVTAVAMALSLPMRMLSPLGTVALDSFGKWRLRTGLLILDSTTMMLAALIGASLADLTGASIAVAIQRFVSGLVDFSFANRVLGRGAAEIAGFAWRAFLPFLLPAAALVAWNVLHPVQVSSVMSALTSLGRTFAGIAVFGLIAYACDRRVIDEVLTVVRNLLFRKRSPSISQS